MCSGHGRCTADKVCECNHPFTGEDCSNRLCPGDCSGHGFCINSTCYCKTGWSGAGCETNLCDCVHGDCRIDNLCICHPGWTGPDCNLRTCMETCNDTNGACVNGECACFPGFSGQHCSPICPSQVNYDLGSRCSDHGKCSENGTCWCNPGWGGVDCGDRTCPGQCSGRGVCNHGSCVCDPRYTGEDCAHAVDTSPEDCTCTILCTVSCLDYCRSVDEQLGPNEGHACFQKCNRQCIVGCAISGKPNVDEFHPYQSLDAQQKLNLIDPSTAMQTEVPTTVINPVMDASLELPTF